MTRDGSSITDPGANIRAAARHMRERYGSEGWTVWKNTWPATWGNSNEEEKDMGSTQTTIAAPHNPYRMAEVHGDVLSGMEGFSTGESFARPPRHDTEAGPGLTAYDIDRIAHEHFRRGHATATRSAEETIEALRLKHAAIFDEGYTAGRAERAQGVARDLRRWLVDVHFILQAAEGAPKSKVHERLPAVRASLDGALAFAGALMGDSHVAAAQVARDA